MSLTQYYYIPGKTVPNAALGPVNLQSSSLEKTASKCLIYYWLQGFTSRGDSIRVFNWDDLNTEEEDHGIYLKKERLFAVKLMCNWCSSEDLMKEWSVMGDNVYSVYEAHTDTFPIKFKSFEVTDRNYVNYYVIANAAVGLDALSFTPKRTIIFTMEPWCSHAIGHHGVNTWGPEWSLPDSSKYLAVRGREPGATISRYLNNCAWQLDLTYNELCKLDVTRKVFKKNIVSCVVSSKDYDPGHIYRLNLLDHLDKHKGVVRIFSKRNFRKWKYYSGFVPYEEKSKGILPFKYYLAVENCKEPGYVTEKFYEAILLGCLPFYWGAPDISSFFDPLSYVTLPEGNVVEAANIIMEAIKADLWTERLPAIRAARKYILEEIACFPTVNNIITEHDKMAKQQFLDEGNVIVEGEDMQFN